VQETYRDLADVDLSAFRAVAVCTPTHLHVPQATQAAEAGCHLFVEGPLSLSLAGVDTLLELVRTRTVVLQVGHALRSHPGLRLVREWLDRGEIGEVVAGRVKVGLYLPEDRPDYRDTYRTRVATGGGCLLDAAHQLDCLQWLLGLPSQVSCFAGRLGHWDAEADVEDVAALLLRFPSGAVIDLHISHLQRDPTDELELIGRDGTIVWSRHDAQASLYRAVSREWERRDFALDPDDLYREQAYSFLAAVTNRVAPRVTGEDGLSALRIALAALQAARTNAVVRVEGQDICAKSP
jgi:predicted dehydrogenase